MNTKIMPKGNIVNGSKNTFLALVTAASTALCLVGSASAASLSGEKLVDYGPEEAYWVVEVSCEEGSQPRVIRRKTDGAQWCGSEIEGFCFDQKPQAADAVCGTEYSQALDSKEQEKQAKAQAERAKREAADQKRQAAQTAAEQRAAQLRAQEAQRRSQINIDEEMLKIEQEKLSLRRQELELQRRAVEIREALEALDKES